MLDDLPNVDPEALIPILPEEFGSSNDAPPIRVLLLYGSLRPRAFSRLLAEEAERILRAYGADTQCFDPHDLPLPDATDADHPRVAALREAVTWCDAMVWCSPERHGAMTAIFKAQIDWIPLALGSVRPTQGKTLAIMQVSGGSQSFNTVNQLRILGRWMRLITIPNQSSVPKAFQQFDDNNRMKPGALYNRVVDVMEELVRMTYLTRPYREALVNRYSERVETAEALSQRVNQTDL